MTTKSYFSFFKNYWDNLNAITDKFIIHKQEYAFPMITLHFVIPGLKSLRESGIYKFLTRLAGLFTYSPLTEWLEALSAKWNKRFHT